MTSVEFQAWLSRVNRPPLVMGVLNVTPDSFSDGGCYAEPEAAAAHARDMAAAGADIIDIGGESTRPGATRVDADEQIRRVIPALRRIGRDFPIVISVDTTRAAVAAAALKAGAGIINDISAGREDPEMFALAARKGVPIILMHMLGQPATMQERPQYGDVVAEVKKFLAGRLAAAVAAGIDEKQVLLDPGIGFGKTTRHNLLLLKGLGELKNLGQPLVLGVSRKRFIGQIVGSSDTQSRLLGSAAAVAWSLANGADVERVHDVGQMRRVVGAISAMRNPDSANFSADS